MENFGVPLDSNQHVEKAARKRFIFKGSSKDDVRDALDVIANRKCAAPFDLSILLDARKDAIGEEISILSIKQTLMGLMTLVAVIKHVPTAYHWT